MVTVMLCCDLFCTWSGTCYVMPVMFYICFLAHLLCYACDLFYICDLAHLLLTSSNVIAVMSALSYDVSSTPVDKVIATGQCL